jgi:uncharacterized repeat protein (TIGR03803 family)
MKSLDFGRYVLGGFAAAAMLAGCGGSQPLIGAPGAMPQASVSLVRVPANPSVKPVLRHKPTVVENVIYSFRTGSGSMADGHYPHSGLINVNGTLYGTTSVGGAYGLRHDPGGFGTVFSTTTSGAETVLHRFKGGDGKYPFAGLIDVSGTLYGTTRGGGKSHGTFFSTTPDGMATVLHSFSGGDGSEPQGNLLNVHGTLYGATRFGGKHNGGTVFSITPSGAETLLHSFGGTGDGYGPMAGIIKVNGTLYGTTYYQDLSGSYGTVFSITPSGKETVLHSFKGGAKDGAAPQASLLNVNGTLYGTTFYGGAYGGSSCSPLGGCGTVFSITPSGTETVLHSFGSSGDGKEPQADLIDVNGTLYGTTVYGGTYGRGTVFSITPYGTETVLYSFGAPGDGEEPEADLIDVNATLYGTTVYGGAYGPGTVYSITGF